VLALWLTRLGARVRIVDKTTEAGTTSRALAVQARTLELYSQIGIAGAVIERGRKTIAREFLGGRKTRGTLCARQNGCGPQPVSLRAGFSPGRARASIDRAPGPKPALRLKRETELVGFQETGGRAIARLKQAGRRTADLRGCLHCRVRWRAFHRSRGARDRFSGWHLQPPFLCRRMCRRAAPL